MHKAPLRGWWVMLAMCIVAPLAAQSPPVDGLAVYYPFNGNATDETGYGDDGTVYGATLTTDRHGRADSAFSFNYENLEFISAHGDGHAVQGVPSRTYSIWFKRSTTAADDPILNPLFTQFAGGTGALFSVELVGPTLQVSLLYQYPGSYPYIATEGPDQRMRDGQWHHLVCVVETNGVSAYLDANTIIWDDEPRPPEREWILPGEFGFFVGAGFRYGYSYGFDGALDDLRVYRRALSIREVRALYEFEQIVPAFTLMVPGTNQFLLQWNQAAKGMRLQRTTSLTQPDWQTLSGSEDLNGVALPIWSGNEFFRLVKP